MSQTIPQNEEELEAVSEAMEKMVKDNGKKPKLILQSLKDLIRILMD